MPLPDLEMFSFTLCMKWNNSDCVFTEPHNATLQFIREVAEIVTALPPMQVSVGRLIPLYSW